MTTQAEKRQRIVTDLTAQRDGWVRRANELDVAVDRYRLALKEGYSCPRCGWTPGDPFPPPGDPYPPPRWGPCDICADARALLAEETDRDHYPIEVIVPGVGRCKLVPASHGTPFVDGGFYRIRLILTEETDRD